MLLLETETDGGEDVSYEECDLWYFECDFSISGLFTATSSKSILIQQLGKFLVSTFQDSWSKTLGETP